MTKELSTVNKSRTKFWKSISQGLVVKKKKENFKHPLGHIKKWKEYSTTMALTRGY